jgi:hypothetical protein
VQQSALRLERRRMRCAARTLLPNRMWFWQIGS